MVLAVNICFGELVSPQCFKRSPCQKARRAVQFLQANGELIDAIRHEQSLLLVTLSKARPDANNGRKLSVVKDWDLMCRDLPESLILSLEWPNRHSLITQDSVTRARAKHVLSDGASRLEGRTLGMVVRRRRVRTSGAKCRAHHQFKRASVENARDLLTPDIKVCIVLHILVIM